MKANCHSLMMDLDESKLSQSVDSSSWNKIVTV